MPCADPAALRVDPAFRVISGILGEDLDPFRPIHPAAQPDGHAAPQAGGVPDWTLPPAKDDPLAGDDPHARE